MRHLFVSVFLGFGTKALWQNPFPGSGTFFLQKTKH
jgi:hypothetical protein